eukprot:TRINITY_DN920_c0_g1_i1.p1 TRINITY_DN920_c0_g1~~TRINITY_DN920_c0_g1_i1.p1  ORF type:complete len:362 (+),score=69.78 TRINITY_DN920_c0_g1_i1:673-1758(+)
MPRHLVVSVEDPDFYAVHQFLRIGVAIAILVACIFLRKIVAKSLVNVIFMILSHIKEDSTKKQIHDVIAGPVEFSCLFIGVFGAGSVLRLPPDLQIVFKYILLSFLDVLLFWVLYRAITPISHVIQKTSTGGVSEEIRKVISDIVKIGIVIFGFLTVLQAWGVNVAAFLAGLGLAGMAVALAAQDTLKNLFASFEMFADKSFKKGDWIKTSSVEGIVEKVSLRTTTIRRFDSSTVIVPNANLSNGPITNFSPCTHRKVSWSLPIAGGATREQLVNVQKKVDQYIRGNKDVVNGEGSTIIVALDEFGENCVTLFVFFYTVTADWLPYMRVKQSILLDVKKIVEQETNGFGVPTRNLKMVKLN